MKKAERIRCPAPLPEDSADSVLTRMLAPASYQISAGEGKVESEKTRDDLRSRGKLDIESGEIDISSLVDKGEREASIPSPFRKKRAVTEGWEGRSPKRRKMPPSSGSGLKGDAVEQLRHEDKPSTKP